MRPEPRQEISSSENTRRRVRLRAKSLSALEPSRRIKAAGQRADRGAGNGAGIDAMLGQPLDDADMRPAARRARAERQADGGMRAVPVS